MSELPGELWKRLEQSNAYLDETLARGDKNLTKLARILALCDDSIAEHGTEVYQFMQRVRGIITGECG